MQHTDVAAAERLIAKWKGVAASELSTSQSFLIDLCELLGVERPHPTPEQDYMFERPLTFQHADGSSSAGRVDLYRRGAFVLESKKIKAGAHTKGFDEAMLRAHSQAQNYARALPASEGRPPFLVVVDVGHRIELYAEFSRSGGSYVPFPDPRSYRIALEDLRKPDILERLRKVWTDPLALDPSREAARVTRDIAKQLAELAKSLERSGHDAEAVAQFLMRCLFTMFAEDVRLLPKDSFRDLLKTHAHTPDVAMRMVAQLWKDMDGGGFSAVLAGDVLKFNGKLFKQPDTLPLDSTQIQLLIDAASAKWEHVEPAIFGTLLERALSPGERHKLGAHYTPRAYVERLVLPTVIEPLRAEWSDAQAAALTLAAEGKPDEAVAELLKFHHRLCTVRVLDPACGSGNFLYVTLEHLKRLEGEVLNALDEIGYRQSGLALGGERADAQAGETVDPHNLLGIELNPRAAAIAEVVLWIGYLQWHFRTRGDVKPPIPVIRDFRNIENRDAVLAHDGMEYVLDAAGVPVTRWDGETLKVSPVTGEMIPDETARKPIERYVNPRKAAWPQADFVVGNPPFIGKRNLRIALGDGYVDALRFAWRDLPDSADFVMCWWQEAGQLAREGRLERFGFITTNSISQTFNRRVSESLLADSQHPISIVYAIPDHPWVDATDGAAVRIAMTVATSGRLAGRLNQVIVEAAGNTEEISVTLFERRGVIRADLTIGPDLSRACALTANLELSNIGVIPLGSGFILSPLEARQLASGLTEKAQARIIREYRNGRDLTDRPRGVFAIDTFEYTEEELRAEAPAVWQWLHDRVKPERDQNPRRGRRENWWRYGEDHPRARRAISGLPRYIATVMTAKHRVFQFLDAALLPDQKLVVIGLDDSAHLGVLSSKVHEAWALRSGSRLGVGNDPVYVKSRGFEAFPFPCATEEQTAQIRSLAEHLDTHRKRQQAAHPDLTLTGMYNVLDKLRSGEPLAAKERVIHEHGLVSVLRQLHDDLDAAVLDAYGWSDLLPLLRIAHGNDAVLPSPSGRRAGDEGASREELPAPPTPLPGGEGSKAPSPPTPLPGGEGSKAPATIKRPLPEESLHFARELRKTMTDPERIMWALLRDRGLQGQKFRRQHPWLPYTLDFYCHELKLAVEIDGSQHADSPTDAGRDAALREAGIETVRYWNHDVVHRTEQVLEDLWGRMLERAPSPPAPLPGGEGSAVPSLAAPLPAGAGGGAAMSRDDAKRAFDDAILERLVALNAERAAEEARGHIRWLRPEFQNPQATAAPQQTELDATTEDDIPSPLAGEGGAQRRERGTPDKPIPWPKDTVEQVRAVADLLAASPAPLSLHEIEARFTSRGAWKKRLPQLVEMLVALGRAEVREGGVVGVGR